MYTGQRERVPLCDSRTASARLRPCAREGAPNGVRVHHGSQRGGRMRHSQRERGARRSNAPVHTHTPIATHPHSHEANTTSPSSLASLLHGGGAVGGGRRSDERARPGEVRAGGGRGLG